MRHLLVIALGACGGGSSPAPPLVLSNEPAPPPAVTATAAPDGGIEKGNGGCDFPEDLPITIGGAVHRVAVLYCHEGPITGEPREKKYSELVLWGPNGSMLDDPKVEKLLDRWTEDADVSQFYNLPAVLSASKGDDAIVLVNTHRVFATTKTSAKVLVLDGSEWRDMYEVFATLIDVEATADGRGAIVEICNDTATRCNEEKGKRVREEWRWSGTKLGRKPAR